jgi:hypothetical protein
MRYKIMRVISSEHECVMYPVALNGLKLESSCCKTSVQSALDKANLLGSVRNDIE